MSCYDGIGGGSMSQSTKHDSPTVNSDLFNENRNKVPYPEIARYAGMEVAWDLEGTRIISGAATFEELVRVLESNGIALDQVVFSYVPTEDESLLF
jgi:hypothetical protein